MIIRDDVWYIHARLSSKEKFVSLAGIRQTTEDIGKGKIREYIRRK